MAFKKPQKTDAILAAINSKLDSMGGVAPRADIEKLYGRAMIEEFVSKNYLKSVTLINKDPKATSPKFSVICNATWPLDRPKPVWMK